MALTKRIRFKIISFLLISVYDLARMLEHEIRSWSLFWPLKVQLKRVGRSLDPKRKIGPRERKKDFGGKLNLDVVKLRV